MMGTGKEVSMFGACSGKNVTKIHWDEAFPISFYQPMAFGQLPNHVAACATMSPKKGCSAIFLPFSQGGRRKRREGSLGDEEVAAKYIYMNIRSPWVACRIVWPVLSEGWISGYNMIMDD